MVVDAPITVLTSWFVWSYVGACECRRSVAMRFSAALSSTTTLSAWSTSRFMVSTELYGCTTTSENSSEFGKTL